MPERRCGSHGRGAGGGGGGFCRQVEATWSPANGSAATFTPHGLAKRAGIDDIDEDAEAERRNGEFNGYAEANAEIDGAADKAGLIPELKGPWPPEPHRRS